VFVFYFYLQDCSQVLSLHPSRLGLKMYSSSDSQPVHLYPYPPFGSSPSAPRPSYNLTVVRAIEGEGPSSSYGGGDGGSDPKEGVSEAKLEEGAGKNGKVQVQPRVDHGSWLRLVARLMR